MTAPGDNLEFFESAAFIARVQGLDDVRLALQDRLRNQPNAGRLICGPLHTLELTVAGRLTAYIYGRKGQRVTVAYVFDLPKEQKAFDARLAEMKKLYCVGSQRSKP
jgi:hypothetical protein